MGDILKEAIADAKAVRETALQNAKMALEEAFTPQLKSMLSAKLKEDEMDDEEEVAVDDDGGEEGEEEPEEMMSKDEMSYEDEEMGEEEPELDLGDDEGDEEMGDDEMEENIIELNGQKFALTPIEEDEVSESEFSESEEDITDLDLESVIKELETEISESNDDDDTVDESTEDDDTVDESADEEVEIDEAILDEDEEEEDDDEEVDEGKTPAVSSGIGSGDNSKNDDNYAPTTDPGKGKLKEVQEELSEYKEAVSFLKDKLHEVNILNAKLLFTNKLFKEYVLNNDQKLKVVETFDRAQTTREIKLVYSTLAEQFSGNGSIKKKSIKESASAAVSSTKPSKESKKVISEENDVANRFRKLAGLVNG
jgi:hypothetical protein